VFETLPILVESVRHAERKFMYTAGPRHS
jgi:hypothetical protein